MKHEIDNLKDHVKQSQSYDFDSDESVDEFMKKQ